MRSSSIASRLALGLGCLAGLSEAFATPEKLAKLAQRDDLSVDDILAGLNGLKQSRTLGPITDPIQGEQATKAR